MVVYPVLHIDRFRQFKSAFLVVILSLVFDCFFPHSATCKSSWSTSLPVQTCGHCHPFPRWMRRATSSLPTCMQSPSSVGSYRVACAFAADACIDVYLTCGMTCAPLLSLAGEDALVNVSVENRPDGSIRGHIRIRSKTQGVALSLGDKITETQRRKKKSEE